jgi:hypothetical protein
MKRILIASVIAVFSVVGAVSQYAAPGVPPEKQPPEKQPQKVLFPATGVAKFAGTYYSGDGLGVNITLALMADGSYTAEWRGCGGPYGQAAGKWRVADKTLVLTPHKETDMMKRFTKTLDVMERDGRVIFVEPKMREFFKKYGINRASCFQRTDQLEWGLIPHLY